MSQVIRKLLVVTCLVITCQDALAWSAEPGNSGMQGDAGEKECDLAPSAKPTTAPHFESLMAFGAASIALMMLCRAYQHESPSLVGGTLIFSLMASVYGFLQGAWPLGIALGAYAMFLLRSCVALRRRLPRKETITRPCLAAPQRWDESRMSRLFGSNN